MAFRSRFCYPKEQLENNVSHTGSSFSLLLTVPLPFQDDPNLIGEESHKNDMDASHDSLKQENSSPDANVGDRLTKYYPQAYTDLPGGPPTVYKSGPAWPVGIDPDLRPPSFNHPMRKIWDDIGPRIVQSLKSHGVKWSSINPAAFADGDEAKPFCPFLVWVGVIPESLPYDTAVAAANTIKGILAEASFPEIEVAFCESVVERY